MLKIAIASVMKNEGPYILEWLAWHRLMGVGHFIIADNDSSDGLSAILTRLDACGVLTRIPLPNRSGVAPQYDAYNQISSEHSNTADWIFFLDADEFLWSEKGLGGLATFIASVPEDVGAVALNWAVYGSSSRVAPGEGTVMSRFPNRAPQGFHVNRHYKTLVRSAALRSSSRNVHHISINRGWRRVDTLLRDLRIHEGNKGISEDVVWDKLRINHYVVKSWMEFWLKKVARGRATGMREQRNRDFFRGHDRNEVYDPLPYDLHAKLMKEVEALRQLLEDLPSQVVHLDRAIALEQLRYGGAHDQGRGNIDHAIIDAKGTLVIKGWAIDGQGAALAKLNVRCEEASLPIAQLVRIPRPDVVRTFPDSTLDCGFELRIPATQLPAGGVLNKRVQICMQPNEVLYGNPRVIVASK